MRILIALLLVTASLAATPGASAACDTITRETSAATVSTELALTSCENAYADEFYSYTYRQERTGLTVSESTTGVSARGTVIDTTYSEQYADNWDAMYRQRVVEVAVIQDGSVLLYGGSSLADGAFHSGTYCRDEASASAVVADPRGQAYVTRSAWGGTDEPIPCGTLPGLLP